MQSAIAPPLLAPRTAATQQACCDFQRDGNVALGTPGYLYEASCEKPVSNTQWDFNSLILKTNSILLLFIP